MVLSIQYTQNVGSLIVIQAQDTLLQAHKLQATRPLVYSVHISALAYYSETTQSMLTEWVKPGMQLCRRVKINLAFDF